MAMGWKWRMLACGGMNLSAAILGCSSSPSVVDAGTGSPTLVGTSTQSASNPTDASTQAVPPVPADKKQDWCPGEEHMVFNCQEDPSCRPQRGKTPHERECWAVSGATGNLERNVREDIDNSCALRHWAVDLDDFGALNERAVKNQAIHTAPVREGALAFARAQHSLADAARALAGALETRDPVAYRRARGELEAALLRSEAATIAYVATCSDSD